MTLVSNSCAPLWELVNQVNLHLHSFKFQSDGSIRGLAHVPSHRWWIHTERTSNQRLKRDIPEKVTQAQ
jgi:hypothetical protein